MHWKKLRGEVTGKKYLHRGNPVLGDHQFTKKAPKTGRFIHLPNGYQAVTGSAEDRYANSGIRAIFA
jgi:hypothetical protein